MRMGWFSAVAAAAALSFVSFASPAASDERAGTQTKAHLVRIGSSPYFVGAGDTLTLELELDRQAGPEGYVAELVGDRDIPFPSVLAVKPGETRATSQVRIPEDHRGGYTTFQVKGTGGDRVSGAFVVEAPEIDRNAVLTPRSIFRPGETYTCRFWLKDPAPKSGARFSISVDKDDLVSAPGSAKVSAGEREVTFTIRIGKTQNVVPVRITIASPCGKEVVHCITVHGE